MNEEINFLLNFDFQNAGAKEAEDMMTRFIAYFEEFKDAVSLASPQLDRFIQKKKELLSLAKKYSDVAKEENGVSKENIAVLQSIIIECRNLSKELNTVSDSKKNLSKSSEQLAGELKAARDMVKKLSGDLIKMETENKRVGEGYIKTVSILNSYKNKVIEITAEIKNSNSQQAEYAGIITQTKERIIELEASLDNFKSVEELSSAAAKELKDEIAGLNVILKELSVQTSGQLTAEQALIKVREANIKMQNDINAIETRSIGIKADLIIAEQKYKAEVSDAVNIKLTGYTLAEQAELEAAIKHEELMQAQAAKDAEIEAKEYARKEAYQNKLWQDLLKQKERETELRIVAINKELADLEAASEKKDAIKQKELQKEKVYIEQRIAAVQKENLRIAALYIDEINKEIAADEKAAIAHEKSMEKLNSGGAKGVWTLENIIQKIDLMGVRMIASLFWWGLIISAGTALWEIWTEIDDVTKRALDRLKDYFSSFESFKKSQEDSSSEILTSSSTRKADFTTAASIMKESNNLETQYNQYQKMLQIAPKVLDALSKEDFARERNSERMQKQIEQAGKLIDAQSKLESHEKQRATSQKLLNDNEEQQELLKKKIVSDVRKYPENYGLENMIGKMSDSDVLKQVSKSVGTEGYLINGKTDIDIARYNKLVKQRPELERDNSTLYKDVDEDLRKIAELEGNTKNKKGRSLVNHDLEEARALEKSFNESRIASINENFENTPKSDNDRRDRLSSLDEEAKRHNEAMGKAIDDNVDKSKDSFLKIAKYREEDLRDLKKTNAEIRKEANNDALETQKYNEEKLKQIREINKKNLEIVEQARKDSEAAQLNASQDKRKKRSLSYFNPIQAFFRGGANSEVQDTKDRRDEIKEKIEIAKNDRVVSGDKFSDALTNEQRLKAKVDANSLVENPGQLQKDSFKKDNDEYIKAQEERKSAQAKFDSDSEKEKKERAALDYDLLTEKQKNEVKVAEAIFNTTTKIANTAFEAQKKRIQDQMNMVSAQYAFETKLAGNNSAAKIRLALLEHSQILKLKRELAKSQKAESIFEATTNGAVAVTSALKTSPAWLGIALAGIVGAAALLQVSKIEGQALPQYKKGRRGGRRELAILNEDGPEIGQLPSGELRVHAGGKMGLGLLEEGENILTNQESGKYLKDMAKGNAAYSKENKIQFIQSQISKEDLKWAVSEGIKDMKAPIIVMPAQNVGDRLNRTMARNGAF